MRRREFIAVLGGAVVMPFAARAQQPTMPVIGFLYPGVPELSTGIVAAFRKGLDETGFVEGRNVAVDFRFAYNDNARLRELASELVRRRVAVIATPGSTPSALAAKAATATIPIAFGIGPDPVEIGLVASTPPLRLWIAEVCFGLTDLRASSGWGMPPMSLMGH